MTKTIDNLYPYYNHLAKNIVFQAMVDYLAGRKRQKKLGDKKSKERKKVDKEISDLRTFFLSEECEFLADIKGSIILVRLEQMAAEGKYILTKFLDGNERFYK